jgi:hypothetical protein
MSPFHGDTYDDGLDHYRLKNNAQRVFVLLLDGEWHTPAELWQVGGAAWDSRIRDLRKDGFGGFAIDAERDPAHPEESGAWHYRLDLDSVTPEAKRRVLEWTIEREPPNRSKVKSVRQGLITRIKRMQLDEMQRLVRIIDGGQVTNPRKAKSVEPGQASLFEEGA